MSPNEPGVPVPANIGPGRGQGPLPNNPLVGTASNTGTGVLGQSNNGPGVLGQSVGIGGSVGSGILRQMPPSDGVRGEGLVGVHGVSGWPASYGGAGVLGENTSSGSGVHGKSNSPQAAGVLGENTGGGAGVLGQGSFNGVQGTSSNPSASGVWGENSASGYGVGGKSAGGPGVHGESVGGDGVVGITSDPNHSGVAAVNGSTGHGLWVSNQPGGQAAGHFQGDVEVIGKLTAEDITGALVTCLNGLKLIGDLNCIGGDIILAHGDCAEDFEMSGAVDIDPGAVVVIDSGGGIKQCDRPYDKRVAGVVSGAGDCKPGIILGRQQLQENKRPVALVGKVFCKVDAGYSPIEVGDLLTTSPTLGHAMKASDQGCAFGAVLGKALRPLPSGLGLVPVLVALQ
jgi:hypothetical protein